MAEVVQELLSLHGGISQQDVALRLDQQVEDSINCYHTIESGTRRRNPTVLVGTSSGADSDCWTYSYDRGMSSDYNEKYSISFDENGLRAIDLNTGKNIRVEDRSNDYMYPYTSETGYSAVTVKDYTFVTNRNKECKLEDPSGIGIEEYEKFCYVWIKKAEPVDGYYYTVKLYDENNIARDIIAVSGILNTASVAIDIANQLTERGYEVETRNANVLRISHPDIKTFGRIDVTDDYGNTAISGINKIVATENDLPKDATLDAIVQVGKTTTAESNYWLKYDGNSWVETRSPYDAHTFDKNTMPHKLTREYDTNGDVYFLFEPIDWDERLVGDSDGSEAPSFIGTSITDIFFSENRLGLLTPFGIVYSEVGSYYNFWRTSQVTTLASDRIDVELSSKKAIRLHYAEFLENDLIIFGDKTQFKLSYNGSLSATTLSATIISSYDYNYRVKPLALDNKIFFTAKNNNYNALYSFRKEALGETSVADKLTSHVPYLLDGDISQMVGSSVNSVIFLRSNSNPEIVYVYKYLEDNGKLIQSSWFKWTFTSDIHSLFCGEGKLFLLGTRLNIVNDEQTDWILYDGSWNDELIWRDDSFWNTSIGVSTIDTLEYMDIIPNEVDSTYLDIGEVSYTSKVVLSEYIPSLGGKKSISNKVNLKTIYIKSSDDSIFELEIQNPSRNHLRTITQEYVIGRRPYIMGKAKDTKISIKSNKEKGFEINGIAIEARINNRSKKI